MTYMNHMGWGKWEEDGTTTELVPRTCRTEVQGPPLSLNVYLDPIISVASSE